MLSEKDIKKFEKKIVLKNLPYSICIEPTNYCNFRCKMCGNDRMKRKKGYMTVQLFKKIIDELSVKAPKISLWINGYGEPLLHHGIADMLSYARTAGMEDVSVNTNAMLMDDRMADAVIESKIDNVIFSIDGYTKETYESIRTGGVRETVYANVLNFMEKNRQDGEHIRVEIQIIEMDENESEREEFVRFWRSQGAYIKTKSYISWGGNVEGQHEMLPNRYACPICNNMQINWDGSVSQCSSADLDGNYLICSPGGYFECIRQND